MEVSNLFSFFLVFLPNLIAFSNFLISAVVLICVFECGGISRNVFCLLPGLKIE